MIFRPFAIRVLSPICLTVALAGPATALAEPPPAGTAPATNTSGNSSRSSSTDAASAADVEHTFRGLLDALMADPSALSAERTKAAREAHESLVKGLRTFADKNPGPVTNLSDKQAEELLGQLPDPAALMQGVFKDLPPDQAQKLHAMMEQARKDSTNRKSSTKTTTSKDGKTTTTSSSDSSSSSSKQSNSSSDSSSSNKSDSSSSSNKSNSSNSSKNEKTDKSEKADKHGGKDGGSSSTSSEAQQGGKKSASTSSGSSNSKDKKTSKQKLVERLNAALNELDAKDREQVEKKLGLTR